MAVPVIPQQSIVKPQELSHTSIPVPTIDESSGLSQNKQSQAKKRKRRASTTTGNSNISSTKKKSPDAPNVVMPSQDVMIVGEPSLMGGDLGEDDERMITRLVNTQYDGSNGLDDEEYRGSPIETTHMSSWNSDRKTAQDDKGMD
ncbi:uncharacterized protein TRIADDRAFT_61768 [Trichoplax adhaerens]|uniref:LIM interaction domain-containing protein n=1 Tax=Trichoplax adhaerens TaxID=10228 RepID=B3SBX3_TRIAD|nr:hypothetical protein TRIADDRAFT_61768 [Trichoplax adhaerens]EDV19749.1 hypothetical protein TRIADDRAFT_61768 [Trichoplax adhaerens]|eukprot:XP_002117773.1 hypothetical protein TRIADDRAFT_61768 [Trichoplax adhaerens]